MPRAVAHPLVSGHSHAVVKKFSSLEEAEAFLESYGWPWGSHHIHNSGPTAIQTPVGRKQRYYAVAHGRNAGIFLSWV